MDFLIRKVLTETEYAALSTTLSPYDGVVVVSDSDPAVVVKLAIGTQTFLPSSGGDVYAPSDATFLTATDETTALTNSIDLGLTNPGNGEKSILMNNPVATGVAKVEALALTDDNSGFMWVDNSGALTQARTLNFTTTSGAQDFIINGAAAITFTATSYAFNGNTVASDSAFYAPAMYSAVLSNIVGSGITFQPTGAPSLNVDFNAATTVTIAHDLFLTGLTATTGTALILDGSNQVRLLTSSKRFKEDINEFETTKEFINNFLELNPVTFRYKKQDGEKKDEKETLGLIAEEVVELFPEAVNLDAEGLPFSISYDQLTTLTIGVVQQLYLEIKMLREQVVRLENLCGGADRVIN